MKKIIAVFLSLFLICGMVITASAADTTATLSGVPSEIKKDATATITVSISDSPILSSALIQVTMDSGIELISGEWKKDGVMKDVNVSNGHGVLAFTGSQTLNGTVFSFVIKGKTISADAQSIKVEFTFSNESSVVGNATARGTVKVVCASHAYGSWSNISAKEHNRTCSACGKVETSAHTWNGGSVTKAANCNETGIKTYTCTATGCGATKTETIAKTTNHTYGNWTQTKAPSCTGKGVEARTCSTCQKVETKDVAATGHKMGTWTTTKEANCEEKGVQVRNCSKCSHKETKDVAALGHEFSNPTTTKQPTCTETGTETGKCVRCNKETTSVVAATGHSFGKWTDLKAPTCTEKGEQERKCSKCDDIEKRATNALGHNFDNFVIVKEPTLTEKGIEEGTCKTCGEKTRVDIPCVFVDEKTGIEIKTDEGVFQEGTEIKIDVIEEEHTTFKIIENSLKEVASEFVAYDVSAIRNDIVVQPNGTVTVSFKIPEGFGKNIAIFYISDEGISEKLESAISEDGTSISATLTHFSAYAVVKLDDVDTEINVDDTIEEEPNNIPWGVIVVIFAIVVVGTLTTIIVLKKKKQK